MELKDTAGMMSSPDYKERFKAEYYQLKIRYEKLTVMLANWHKLDFNPSCSKDLLEQQADIMYNYMKLLENRAQIENITL